MKMFYVRPKARPRRHWSLSGRAWWGASMGSFSSSVENDGGDVVDVRRWWSFSRGGPKSGPAIDPLWVL